MPVSHSLARNQATAAAVRFRRALAIPSDMRALGVLAVEN